MFAYDLPSQCVLCADLEELSQNAVICGRLREESIVDLERQDPGAHFPYTIP